MQTLIPRRILILALLLGFHQAAFAETPISATPGYAVADLKFTLDTDAVAMAPALGPPQVTSPTPDRSVATFVAGLIIGATGLALFRVRSTRQSRNEEPPIMKNHIHEAAARSPATPPSNNASDMAAEMAMTADSGASQKSDEPVCRPSVATLYPCHAPTRDLLTLAKKWAEADAPFHDILTDLQQLGLDILSVQHGAVTSVTGPVRSDNQDAGALFQTVDGTVALVFDGMGGLPKGELASRFALAAFCVEFFGQPQKGTLLMPETRLKRAYERTTERFREAALELNQGRLDNNMFRTTAIVIYLDTVFRDYHVLWQGDGGGWLQREDGAVLELITPHKDALSPHVVTSSLGPTPDQEPQYRCFEAHPGDLLVACSDGIADRTEHGQILSTFRHWKEREAMQDVGNYIVSTYAQLKDDRGRYFADDNMTLVALSLPPTAESQKRTAFIL